MKGSARKKPSHFIWYFTIQSVVDTDLVVLPDLLWHGWAEIVVDIRIAMTKREKRVSGCFIFMTITTKRNEDWRVNVTLAFEKIHQSG